MIGTILTSTVIAAIIASIVAGWTAQRKISVENITQDRRVWREKIRSSALSVHDAFIARDEGLLNKYRAEFRAILNPMDDEDNKIVRCIALPDVEKELECAEEFAERIALLLKHDWDRVKLEAGPFLMRVKCVRDCLNAKIYEPKRKKYSRNL